MGTEPLSVFRSSGARGFSAPVAANPRRIEARKLERVVEVRFTPVACTVQTPEGLVHAKPGDAILVGTEHDQWCVSIDRFAEKYRALPPTLAGQPGSYVSLRNRVMAVHMDQPFEVVLVDGVSRLHGNSGDWLVDYGDGSLSIVAADIFSKTYEILG